MGNIIKAAAKPGAQEVRRRKRQHGNQILNVKGKEVGKVDLPETIFGHKPRQHVSARVRHHLSGQPAPGTAPTRRAAPKSPAAARSPGSRSTPAARARARSAPALGATAASSTGPAQATARTSISRARRRSSALAQALSARAQDGGLVCVKELSLKERQDQAVRGLLKKLGCEGRVLFVLDEHDAAV